MTSNRSAVTTTIDDARVATIAFAPWRINVFGRELIEALTAEFVRLAEDDDLRLAILIGGIGQAFNMGADVKEMAAIADADDAVAFITSLHNLCQSIRDLPVPVIARIEGHCLGGGLEVAASSDLRIASEDSMFGMPEGRLGLPSVIEAALLPSLIGWGKTRELLYTGDTIDSSGALRIVLVEPSCPSIGWTRSLRAGCSRSPSNRAHRQSGSRSGWSRSGKCCRSAKRSRPTSTASASHSATTHRRR